MQILDEHERQRSNCVRSRSWSVHCSVHYESFEDLVQMIEVTLLIERAFFGFLELFRSVFLFFHFFSISIVGGSGANSIHIIVAAIVPILQEFSGARNFRLSLQNIQHTFVATNVALVR